MQAGDGNGIVDLAMGESSEQSAPASAVAEAAQSNGDYMAPWLETEECTACDECTKLNPKIFAYNNDKKAYIVDPDGGPYQDLVKAAEKCTARVIHPGLPKDRSAQRILTSGSKEVKSSTKASNRANGTY